MVIQNMIVGKDRHGKELRCGDICNFKVNSRGDKSEIMKGVIVYDEDSYAFAFATMDDSAPLLYMHVAEYGSIEYEVTIKGDGFVERDGDGGLRDATYCDDEISAKWHAIYRSHLM